MVPDLVLDRDRSVLLSTLSATIIRDTRDKPLDAHRGMFSTVDFSLTPTAFGSSANFAKLFGQYAFYKPVHSIVFANSIRLGLASPFAGSFVPTSQLFFSGGGTTLRSFPINEAGPQRLVPFCDVLQNQSGCVNVTVPVGGRQLFILNSEMRFPTHINKSLGAVIFYDGGNVYSAINFRNFIDNYTNTVGIGLRYATPIGPVRIDLGRNLNPVPGINPTQYYITVGQAFEDVMKWKRIIGWALAGFAALLIIAAVGGYLYLKTNSFQRFAINEIVDKANSATGGQIEIGGFDFNLGTLTAHLYNITVHGTESADQPPLLSADKLTVSLRIISALHRQVTLRELLIEHPVVHFQVTADGKNNLPAAPPSQNSGNSTSVFDLGIEHAQVINGEVNYNDRKIPLAADLYELGTDIHFDSLAKRYAGELSYKNGHLQYADYSPLPHNLNLKFSATPDRLEVQPAVLQIGSSDVTLRAQLSNYANPVADGDYEIRIHTQDFAALSPSVKPAGDVSLTGKLRYQPSGNQPLLRALSIDGQIASDALIAVATGRRIDVKNLQGTYRLANGSLDLTNVSLESFGGKLTAAGKMQHLDGTPETSVQATLSGISLRELQRAAGSQQIPGAALSGTLRGKADAAWKGSIDNLRAHSDLSVQALASSRSNPTAKEVPVNGAIHAAYDGKRQSVELHDTSIQMPSAKLTAQGTISNNSSLQLKVVANDLHQLVSLASSFGSSQPQLPSVSGSATVNATVRGSIQKPVIEAQLDAQNLEVEGSEWKSASIAMQANSSGVTVSSASLINAGQGRMNLSAKLGLKNWAYEPASPVQAHLDAQQLSIGDLLRLAKQNLPVSGNLSAKVDFQGSQLKPSGSGSAQIANARAYGEPIQDLSAKFHTESDTIVSTLRVAAPAGAIDADVSFTPKTKAYIAKVDAPALVLQKLQTLQEKNLGINGTVSFTANGEGTVDNPQLVASMQLPQLSIRDKSISNLKADLKVAEHVANLNLDSQVAEAAVHARGKINLTGDYETDATIDTGVIPFAPLMAAYAPSVPPELNGQSELHATLKGPLKDKTRLEAHIRDTRP